MPTTTGQTGYDWLHMILAAPWVFPVASAPMQNCSVVIDGDRIASVRPVEEKDELLAGTCLLPGLVNAHTHLAYTALRNLHDDLSFFPWIRRLTDIKYQKLSDRQLDASTWLGIRESLASGVTTVADMSDCEPVVSALARSNLRGVFYWEVFGVETDQADKTWQTLQKLHPRFCDQYASDKLQIGISPHACYTVRPELYSRIADWAGKNNVPISFHAAESKDEERFIRERKGVIADFLSSRAGDWRITAVSSISHLATTGIFQTRPLLAHVVQATDTDISVLASHQVPIVHCPKSNAKFGHGIAPVTELLHAGLTVGLGTDSAASNNRLDLFEEARFALLQQRNRYPYPALNEQQVLEMATIGGATALGMQDRIGSLEPGKKADIIGVKIPAHYSSPAQVLSHLIHNTTSADLQFVMIDGKMIQSPDVTEEIRELYTQLFADEASESL